MSHRRYLIPFLLPVATFAGAIAVGSLLLWNDVRLAGHVISGIDSLFLATSAVCVTGLAPLDPFSVLTRGGQAVLIGLMQLGGLGIMTYSALILYLFGKRISMTNRVAMGQALFLSPSFHLGRFIWRVAVAMIGIEAAGAITLAMLEPERLDWFLAMLLAVSSFCNAGFAPWADSLMGLRSAWGFNLVIMLLIVMGGLGFFVLDDLFGLVRQRVKAGKTTALSAG